MRVPGLIAVIAVITAAATSSCVKVEKFSFRDAGGTAGDAPDSGMTFGSGAQARIESGRVVVDLPGLYTFEFSDSGYRFPETLKIGSQQVFAPKRTQCGYEHGVGVSYYPGAMFSSVDDNALNAMDRLINIDLPGPGVAKVGLNWKGMFTGCTGTPYGRSTFTFFPDGRIQRMDAANLDMPLTATDCDCTTETHWELATYYTFDEAIVNGLSGVTMRPAMGASEPAEETICFSGDADAFQLAIGWRAQVGKRIRRITSTSLAAIGDMLPGGTMTTLPAGTATMPIGDTSTTMLIATGTDCASLRNRALPFTDDLQLVITHHGATIDPIGLGQDGVYGGEHSQNFGERGFYVGGISPVKLKAGTTLGGFAARLDFQDMPAIQTVTRNPPALDPQNWYTKQAVLDTEGNPTGEYVLWFPDGLGGTDEIIIEAQP